MLQRRLFIVGAASTVTTACNRSPPPNTPEAPEPPIAPESLTIEGQLQQGGYVIGATTPGAVVTLDGVSTQANARGRFVVGFDRDAPAQSTLIVTSPTGWTETRTLNIAAREYEERTVDGLPRGDPDTDDWFDLADPALASAAGGRGVDDPLSAEDAARVERERQLKHAAWASRVESDGFASRWRRPVPGRRTSSWGSRRRYTGSSRIRTHYGIDFAGGSTTQILAPAAGLVVLAEPDLYYEGGCAFVDHGQGLISHYLHMSRLSVSVNQTIAQGDPIGFVGNTGRANGYHLCWQLRWRDRHLDPMLFVPPVDDASAPRHGE